MFRYLVLGLLRNGDARHGYAVIKDYRKRTGQEASSGNFYRELQRLVGEGLVRTATNPPGADPLHHEYAQGRTSKMTYTDADQNWSWNNSNYMFGTFTIDNVQYEKFAAGLAQKMAQMKDEKAPEKK